jgi:hypothetical protein
MIHKGKQLTDESHDYSEEDLDRVYTCNDSISIGDEKVKGIEKKLLWPIRGYYQTMHS